VFRGTTRPGGVGEIKTYGGWASRPGLSGGAGVIYKMAICSTWNIVLVILYVLYYRYIDG